MRVQLVEYDPWGKVSREEGTTEPSRRFTGKMLDPESGLYYYGGRYYDPELGRFISPDPFVPQPGDPQSFNRYSYVVNNPVNNVDPSGYFFKKLFKKIGKALKNLFKKPGVFFATLGVGIITGGLAGWAAPAAWSATATGAFAGAIGGASAAAVGAAMTGGNIWQGALLGGFGGAVGGGVAGSIGAKTVEGIIGGAVAGGAASGALGSALRGGNFFENVFAGGIASGLLASVQAAAMKGWEVMREFTDGAARASVKHGGAVVLDKSGQVRTDGTLPCVGECTSLLEQAGVTMGQQGRESGHWYTHDSFVGRFINLTSKVHDFFSGWNYSDGAFVGRGVAFNTAFDALYSFPTMLPAAAYTGFAFHGNPYSYSVPLR